MKKITSSVSAEDQTFIRNFVFGAEDSLVSTVGLLSGVAIAGVARPTLVLTGVVLIFVEAFSMGIGSYLSEAITHDENHGERRISMDAAFIMLGSYIVAGLIPLLPYFFWEGITGLSISISCSLLALALLGIISSRLSRTNVRRNTVRMILLGGSAIAVGIIVSFFVK